MSSRSGIDIDDHLHSRKTGTLGILTGKCLKCRHWISESPKLIRERNCPLENVSSGDTRFPMPVACSLLYPSEMLREGVGRIAGQSPVGLVPGTGPMLCHPLSPTYTSG